jgi:hypothetical protein
MHLATAYEAECILDEHPDKATSDDSDARDPLQNSSNVERNNEASSSHPDEDDMKTTRIFDNKLLKAPSVRNVALQREDPDNTPKTPPNTDSVVPNHLQPLISSASQNLCGRQLKAFQQVITEYSDVFSKHDFDLGCFKDIQHRVKTTYEKPIRLQMRRTPLCFQDEEKKALDNMLKAGVIQPSNSEWDSAPVLVRKKDGSVRYCIDYRLLNAKCIKDAFPLPLIDECLDRLSENVFFSILDIDSRVLASRDTP